MELISDVYILKSRGPNTLHWGTPISGQLLDLFRCLNFIVKVIFVSIIVLALLVKRVISWCIVVMSKAIDNL